MRRFKHFAKKSMSVIQFPHELDLLPLLRVVARSSATLDAAVTTTSAAVEAGEIGNRGAEDTVAAWAVYGRPVGCRFCRKDFF